MYMPNVYAEYYYQKRKWDGAPALFYCEAIGDKSVYHETG